MRKTKNRASMFVPLPGGKESEIIAPAGGAAAIADESPKVYADPPNANKAPLFADMVREQDSAAEIADDAPTAFKTRGAKSAAEIDFLANPGKLATEHNNRPATWIIKARYEAGTLPPEWFKDALTAIGDGIAEAERVMGYTEKAMVASWANSLLLSLTPGFMCAKYQTMNKDSWQLEDISVSDYRKYAHSRMWDMIERVYAPKEEAEK